jgi:transposase-like protein
VEVKPDAHPETQLEAIRYFADPAKCEAYMIAKRWPHGVRCPRCNNDSLSYYATARLWRCAPCKKRFSVKVGTIFEASPLPLQKWLPCVWLIVNAKNGVSSCEIGRALGVTQKTAWFMLHRVREALKSGSFEKMKGTVEADESYLGGDGVNMHKDVKKRKLNGRGTTGKAVVMGLLQRGEEGTSKVRLKHIKTPNKGTVHGHVRLNVEPGSNLHTDSMLSYKGLDWDYVHRAVDHAVEYVNGNVHTNSLENFWSLLKRTIKGTYVHVNAAQLEAYLDEQAWRFNERKADDGERFATVSGSLVGRRLTYKRLITRNPAFRA